MKLGGWVGYAKGQYGEKKPYVFFPKISPKVLDGLTRNLVDELDVTMPNRL